MSQKLIIIAGATATGKTKYAEYLSTNLSIPIFCKDTLKELIYAGFQMPIENSDTVKKYGACAYNALYYIAECMMKSKCDFALESNFVEISKQVITKLVDKYNYECMTVMFDAPAKVLHQRFLEREQNGKRHEGLGIGIYDDYEEFERNILPQQNFELKGKFYRIDTTDFRNVDYKVITREVQAFLEK